MEVAMEWTIVVVVLVAVWWLADALVALAQPEPTIEFGPVMSREELIERSNRGAIK
jgi:hypothetical protein